jgi:hypothetical protein
MKNWPHLAIYFVDSCLTNEFDADLWTAYDRVGGRQVDPNAVCLGKALLRRNEGGAVGYLGCTRECIVGATQELRFWEALGLAGQAHLGKMLDHARDLGIGAVGAYQTYLQNLLGDPELPVFTRTPQALTVSHTSFVYGLDRATVSVFHEEAAVTAASVTVCQMSATDPLDKRYFPLVGAAEGSYTFDTASAEDGPIYIVVTAPNTVPYVGSAVKVSDPVSQYKFRTRGFVYDVARKGSGLYAGSGDNNLYALSATHVLGWLRTLNGPIQDIEVATDESVLVGLRKNVANNVLLFNGAGTQLRAWSVGREVYSVARDAVRNAAYIGLQDTGIRAYDTSTAALRWQRTDLGTIIGIAVGPAGDVFATSSAGGSTLLRLASATGATVWSYTVGVDWTFNAKALLVAPDGTAYVSTANHELHKVTPAGVEAWKKSGLSSAAVSLARGGSRLYAGLGDGTLMAIEASGAVAWSRDLGDRLEAIVFRSDEVYVGCWHGVHALDSSGDPLWFRETTGAVLSLVAVGNRLHCGSRDGWVYSIDLPRVIIWPRGDFELVKGRVLVKGIDIAAGLTRVLDTKELLDVLHPPPPKPRPQALRTRRRRTNGVLSGN